MPPRRASGLDVLLPSLGSLGFVEELFDRVRDAVFTVKDPGGRYLAMSQSGVERCGLGSRAAAIGRTAFELWPAEMALRYAEQDASLFRTGRPLVDALDLTLYPDRRPGWCLTQKLPLRDSAGRVMALACLSTDLPEPSRSGFIDAPFAAAVDHIHRHFAQGLRLEELAALAGLSLGQFERRMKKLFQLSPGQYVMKVRIQAAAEALAESSRPIAAIAGEVGFCDQAALNRHFKQVVGLSPAAYRRWAQAGS
jgi:AraC-like DNA-binding protein